MLSSENVWSAVASLEKQFYTHQEIATKLRAYATHGHLTRGEYHTLVNIAKQLESEEPELPF